MSSPEKGCCSVGANPSDFWQPPCPKNKYRTGLRVNNSMAGGKVEFIPHSSGPDARRVTWYGCGPTVYDAAHMGHARTYLAFDVLRRIMVEYFGYEVFMCMNITDIDDKIISRSAESNKDFACLARYWEGRFWQDMQKLNVLLPDVITRVSEYVPQVLDFIQGILDNGLAYESHGSVYFDTQSFRNSKQHVYGRMEPWSVNDEARVLEGEGELGVVTEKRSVLDFALWKKNKPGEPFWDSPWGPGRPGWHIECSAMASTILGFPLDIHSGGVDLRFPHHDNELAQSEARYNKPQWVNYFLHSGHLHIKGSKMSKSLKNFITIGEALQVFNARTFRFLTLMHRWDAPMNYSPDGDSMNAAAEVDKQFVTFFGTVTAALRESGNLEANTDAVGSATSLGDVKLSGVLSEQRWEDADLQIHNAIAVAEKTVHDALLDNFETPVALTGLRTLVGEVNSYLRRSDWKGPLLLKAARYVFRMLRIFGVTSGSEASLDYTEAGNASGDNAVIDMLADFRQDVRAKCQHLLSELKAGGASESALADVKSLLQNCDALRDSKLPSLGLLFEDKPDGSTHWRRQTKEEVEKEQERRRQDEERKKANKATLVAAAEKKERELALPPERLLVETRNEEYSEFDAEGLPTKDIKGEPVSRAQREKLAKLLAKHKIAHEKWQQQK